MGLKIDRRAVRITKGIGIGVLVILLIIMAKIVIWENNYYKTKSVQERAPEQAVITSIADANSPDETEISEEKLNSYQVSRTEPRYLEIPRLEIKARVKSSEVNEHILPNPSNIFDVSWYSGSGRPGENGNILISGISEGQTKHGVFANLDSLEHGDKITLERGDGEKYTYSVQEISIVDRNNAASKLPIAQKRIDDKETLALITTRHANEDSTTYNSIVIVRATRD